MLVAAAIPAGTMPCVQSTVNGKGPQWTSPTSTSGIAKGRKGQFCRVTARGKMNSCCVEFEDGYKMITSRNAIRRRK